MPEAIRETSPNYRFGAFTLVPKARQLLRGETNVTLTSRSFDVLVCLVERAGEVVTKDDLLRRVWAGSIVEESNLSQQIFGLRRAFGDCARFIVTVPGRGYQFVEPVQTVVPLPPSAAGSTKDEPATTDLPLSTEEPLPNPTTRTRLFQRWLVFGTVTGLLLLIVSAALAWKHRHAAKQPSTRRVVIADFQDAVGIPSLSDTLDRALQIDLGQTPFLSLASDAEIAAILKQMGREPGSELTSDVARELCVRANRQVMLTGSVSKFGGTYALELRAVSCADGRYLAGALQNTSSVDDLLPALDRASTQVRTQLGESPRSVEQFDVPIEQATTSSLEALKLYSAASRLAASGSDTEALLLYKKAIELDGKFAMAYEAVATMEYAADEPTLAAEASRRAYQLSEHVSEREKLAIQTHYLADSQGDLLASIRTAKLWAQTYPDDWTPLLLMAGEYNDLGQYPAAIQSGRKALALAKDQAVIYSVLARAERRSNHWAATKEVARQAEAHGAVGTGLHATLYMIAELENDRATLQREETWGKEHGGWFHYAVLAEFAAKHGRMKDCHRFMTFAREKAAAANLPETHDVLLLDEAILNREMGLFENARRILPKVRNVGFSDQADLIVLSARLGQTKPADLYLNSRTHIVTGTIDQFFDRPRIRATLALVQRRPEEAIEALAATEPYDLIDLKVPSMRGEAYLASGRPSEAKEQYQKVLDNPGVDPTSIYLPLAHLALARIYARAKDLSSSKREYAALFDLWKNCDSDLPLLLQARKEAQDLGS